MSQDNNSAERPFDPEVIEQVDPDVGPSLEELADAFVYESEGIVNPSVQNREAWRLTRNREREAWRSVGDRLLAVSAAALGLSMLFLTRSGVELEYKPVLQSAWVSFAAAVLLGILKTVSDYFWTWGTLRIKPRVMHYSVAGSWIFATVGVASFLIGMSLLLAFAWFNLDLLV